MADQNFRIEKMDSTPTGSFVRKDVPALMDEIRLIRNAVFAEEFKDPQKTDLDSTAIRGFSQGRNQCFSTCVIAWATIQGAIKQTDMRSRLNTLHSLVGDDFSGALASPGMLCGNGLTSAENIIVTVMGSEQMGLDVSDFQMGSFYPAGGSVEFDAEKHIAERQAKLIKSGGALVVQRGAHFQLIFSDLHGMLTRYDPISGSLSPINKNEVYNGIFGGSGAEASILELPSMKNKPELRKFMGQRIEFSISDNRPVSVLDKVRIEKTDDGNIVLSNNSGEDIVLGQVRIHPGMSTFVQFDDRIPRATLIIGKTAHKEGYSFGFGLANGKLFVEEIQHFDLSDNE